ncbi:hypothetical protein V1514DRAFT_338554 [Lipomyces japonicus]|uniref:uncharacterized protein n=1 Tax=Lipomyces japonicus TaxID=56871 RepID=UPI0034D00035
MAAITDIPPSSSSARRRPSVTTAPYSIPRNGLHHNHNHPYHLSPLSSSMSSSPSSSSLYPSPPSSISSSLGLSSAATTTGSSSSLTRRILAARRFSDSGESMSGRLKEELKCELCGKGYKHISCLTKHLWEHTPEWTVTSKLLISKHQQVQLLEAASILVSMTEEEDCDEEGDEVDRIMSPGLSLSSALSASSRADSADVMVFDDDDDDDRHFDDDDGDVVGVFGEMDD